MKRLFCSFAVVLLLIFGLSGCNAAISSASPEPNNTASTENNPETNTPEASSAAPPETPGGTLEPESQTPDTKVPDTEKENEMKIKVTDGSYTVIFQLNEGSAAKSLHGQLPLTVEVSNYGSNEKIFYPPEKLDTSNVVEGGGPAGMLAYFSPWGNVVMYYAPFGSYQGLYILGEAAEGAENIENLSGTITVTAE